MSEDQTAHSELRRSKRTKAMDLNRSHYDGDPTHRELDLRVPNVPTRSSSVEQLVTQFDGPRSGAIPKRKIDVRMESIADQIRDCSLALGYDQPIPKDGRTDHVATRLSDSEIEMVGRSNLPTDLHNALHNALRLSRESHQAVQELGTSIRNDMVAFMKEIIEVIEPIKISLAGQTESGVRSNVRKHTYIDEDPKRLGQSQSQLNEIAPSIGSSTRKELDIQPDRDFPQQQTEDRAMLPPTAMVLENQQIWPQYNAAPLTDARWNHLQKYQFVQQGNADNLLPTYNPPSKPNPVMQSHQRSMPQQQPYAVNRPPAGGYAQQSHQDVVFPNSEARSQPPETTGRRTPRMNGSSLQVSKWGLIFDGNRSGLQVDDFLFRLEHLQNMYNCSWNDVLRDFHVLVEGDAKAWYWVFLSTNAKAGYADVDWSTLKCALAKRFKSHKGNYDVLQDILKRRQGLSEPVDKYFLEMMTLMGRLDAPMPEQDAVKLIKDNLNDSLKRIIYPITIYNLEHLRDQCWEAERTFGRREERSFANFNSRHVNRPVADVYYDEPEKEQGDIVEAIQYQHPKKSVQFAKTQGQQPPPVIAEGCWNCKQQGHFYRQCPSAKRGLFCYKCGCPDVVTPTCPHCIKNIRTDA